MIKWKVVAVSTSNIHTITKCNTLESCCICMKIVNVNFSTDQLRKVSCLPRVPTYGSYNFLILVFRATGIGQAKPSRAKLLQDLPYMHS